MYRGICMYLQCFTCFHTCNMLSLVLLPLLALASFLFEVQPWHTCFPHAKSSVCPKCLCSDLFPPCYPSALTQFSALGQTPPGFHRHFLSCLPPLDPVFFLFFDKTHGEGTSLSIFFSWSLPLSYRLSFLLYFLPSVLFRTVQQALQLAGDRRCTK